MPTFEIQVVTPERIVFSGEATSAIVPASDGYLGLLAHHAPLLSALGQGTLTVRTPGGTHEWKIRGGLLEVHGNVASVLTDELFEV